MGDAAARLAAIGQRLAQTSARLDRLGAELEVSRDTAMEHAGRLSRAEARERTRERLLDAAADVFNRTGYHAASLEAVAEAAGYTKGAVYSNFSSKQDLLLALIRRVSRQRLDPIIAALEVLPIDSFIDLSAGFLQAQAASDEAFDVLTVEFWLAAMRDPEVRRVLLEVEHTDSEQIGALVERKLTEAGLVSAFNGEQIAQLMNALGTGLMFQLYMDPEHWDIELFGRTLRLILGLPATGGEVATDGDGVTAAGVAAGAGSATDGEVATDGDVATAAGAAAEGAGRA